MTSSRLGEALDKLFGVPAQEFMNTRDALVNELRAAGDKEAAAAVKAQHKPTLAAHALNRLARTAGPELDELFAASRQLASGKDFKTALERQRTAFEAVRAKMSGSDVAELSGVVRGAMVDEALAERVKTGHFSKVPEVQVGFFGAAPEGGAAPRAEKNTAKKAPPAPAIDRAKLAREREEQEEAERRARQIAKAEADLARLSAAADEAERKATQARRLADEAAEKVRSLKRP